MVTRISAKHLDFVQELTSLTIEQAEVNAKNCVT